MDKKVLRQLLALDGMSLAELQEKYKELFGKEAYAQSTSAIKKRIAYRIQEIYFGGLSEVEKQKLEDLAQSDPVAMLGATKTKPKEVLPGTRFSRLWHGEVHEVIATQDGKFQYKDLVYKSLSAVARKITGTQWNGKLFFGLERQ